MLVLDKSGGHTAKRLVLPENVRPVLLPTSSPELNLIERVWQDLKDDVAWLQFADVASQPAYDADLLQAYDAPTLQSLTSYQYLVDTIHALSTRRNHIRRNCRIPKAASGSQGKTGGSRKASIAMNLVHVVVALA